MSFSRSSLIFLLVIAGLSISALETRADSTGPTSPGTITSSTLSAEVSDWSNESNAAASDDSYARNDDVTAAPHIDLDNSESLNASNFGFTVPSGSRIDGIEIEVERRRVNDPLTDGSVVTVGGIGGGEDKADTSTEWSTAEHNKTYGSSVDLWNKEWTADDINASTFGVSISLRPGTCGAKTCTNADADIDHVRINVYYTPPPPPTRETDDSGDPAAALRVGIKTDQGEGTPALSLTGSSQSGAATTERKIEQEAFKSFELSTKPPDAGEIRSIYIRINGSVYYLSDLSAKQNEPRFIASFPGFAPGVYPYALTADYGFTTLTEHGQLVIEGPKTQLGKVLSGINGILKMASARTLVGISNNHWDVSVKNVERPSFQIDPREVSCYPDNQV